MSEFRGKVRQVYRVQDTILLVLEEDYEGDVGGGDRIEVTLAGGATMRGRIKDLAWGSAFHAEQPPLTLVVFETEGDQPLAGANVRTLPREPENDAKS